MTTIDNCSCACVIAYTSTACLFRTTHCDNCWQLWTSSRLMTSHLLKSVVL